MKLQKASIDLIKKGLKHIVCKKGVRNYQLGTVMLIDEEGFTCGTRDIASLRVIRFDEISEFEADGEGFRDENVLKSYMLTTWSDLKDDSLITVVEFEL